MCITCRTNCIVNSDFLNIFKSKNFLVSFAAAYMYILHKRINTTYRFICYKNIIFIVNLRNEKGYDVQKREVTPLAHPRLFHHLMLDSSIQVFSFST